MEAAVDSLTNELVRDGWQPVGARYHGSLSLPHFRRSVG
jgi:hypothetical protein